LVILNFGPGIPMGEFRISIFGFSAEYRDPLSIPVPTTVGVRNDRITGFFKAFCKKLIL
jgi:hypothetical protein